MAQNPHEYLIEQLQFTGDESVGSSSNKIKLNFNHPCKELVFVVQPDENVDYCSSLECCQNLFKVLGAQPFNYTDAIDALPNSIMAFGGQEGVAAGSHGSSNVAYIDSGGFSMMLVLQILVTSLLGLGLDGLVGEQLNHPTRSLILLQTKTTATI